MPMSRQRPDEGMPLFLREKGVLRSTLTVLATLFALILFAFTAPRAETMLAWAVDGVAALVG